MTFHQVKPTYITSVIFLSILFMALWPQFSVADDSASDPSEFQRSFQYSRADIVLQNIVENVLIIDDERYVFNKQTSVASDNPDLVIDKVGDIPQPALVSIVYQTYSQRTEEVPYPPGTKVLERITFFQKFEVDGQNSRTQKQD